MKIWTDDEYIEVDPNDVGQLEAAMLFKAEHIKAKADPGLFSAVAYMLFRLWDSATKHVDVVRCRECIHRYTENCPMYFHSSYWHEGYEEYVDDDTDHTEDDYFCPKGKRKGDAD